MKFNKLIEGILDNLDPETKKDWEDILPHLSEPKPYHIYEYTYCRGMLDVDHYYTIKATDIEDALNKTQAKAIKDMEQFYKDENMKAEQWMYDEIEIFSITDEAGIVNTGEETARLVSDKKLNRKQIEQLIRNSEH